ncbi:hypothetical protein PS662_05089 [Pseudomonas fluorescens]|uniref:Uncharacterized protein n=1 Tax=Pseudomonas fluorescens TaxID=294 RepID=A0A5E6X181_PSEFL|nr:hypothetical protein [Pseudomonas fluorescens]VVN34746.1 hypothetical protein PS662_05089 [Pseudomonas fluorescens]
MNNSQALKLVETTFSEILKAKNVSDLKQILNSDPLLEKWQMDRTKYPELQLELTAQDISSLMAGKVDKDLRLHADLSARLETPLEKLLYALVWKNGDLQKVAHIIKGAADVRPTSLINGPGQVFRQFGRHLADRSESIVDQHVLRAFELYEQIDTPDSATVKAKRKKINWDKDVACIERYKGWLSKHFKGRQDSEPGFVVNIDMVLFALGRAVKTTRTRGNGEDD